MGAIAAAMARAGRRVTGSDEACYPPMSHYLEQSGLVLRTPYHPDNLPAEAECFVVGKRVDVANAELQAALADGRPLLSFPRFLKQHVIGGSRNLVVAGGVGKTTTSSMLAWILECNGVEPDYLIGGMPLNFEHPARLNGSGVAVLEGDEYASCFNDPLPKFLHYCPEVLVITNVLEDHPDLYNDLAGLQQVFAQLIRQLPPHGLLVLSAHDPGSRRLADHAPCRTVSVGFDGRGEVRICSLGLHATGSRFVIDEAAVDLAMWGRMNVMNAAMAMVAARHVGVGYSDSARALSGFAGVGNRQTARDCGGATLIHDKATHPQALAMLLESLRQRFPGRRLVSLIQPRATGGQGWIYQQQLPGVLAQADLVLLLKPYEHKPKPGQEWPGGAFCIGRLASELAARSVPVESVAELDQLAVVIARHVRPEDVMLATLPEQALELIEQIDVGLMHQTLPVETPVLP